MARVARRETSNGWTTYSPPEEDLATARIKGALDAAVHDCRLFARLAREARLQDLPTRLHLSWEDFCLHRLRHPADVVEAMIAGIEVLGEQVPVPAALAERVGRLARWGRPTKAEREEKGSDTTLIGRGAAYWRARLERDREKHPDIVARLQRGELTPHAAAREAGIIHERTPLEHLQHWWRKATSRERSTFLDWTKA